MVFLGALTLGIVQARHLPVMDIFTSDPFCKAYLTQEGGEDLVKKTEVKSRDVCVFCRLKCQLKYYQQAGGAQFTTLVVVVVSPGILSKQPHGKFEPEMFSIFKSV